MMKKTVCILCAALLLGGWTAPVSGTRNNLKAVSRVPASWADDAHKSVLLGRPVDAMPQPDESGSYDLRSCDLTQLDLSGAGEALRNADFGSWTRWPDTLPEGFDPFAVQEQGKDPGLDVRALHQRGITGKGVGIGIIDQTLLVDHAEYRDRLRYYNEHGRMRELAAQMHGPAVASAAAGKNVGVAPDALLYYIADSYQKEIMVRPGMTEGAGWEYTGDVSNRAKDIDEFIALNKTLPEDEKIRVISISNGWIPDDQGRDEMDAAVARARAAGIAVVWISSEDPLMRRYFGMGREWMADPGDFTKLCPVSWIEEDILAGTRDTDLLLVPIDSRTLASPEGQDAYTFYRNGGLSWAMPYIAGLYALAYQVKPGVSFEEFTEAARKTARPASITRDGKTYPFGRAVDPPALIAALENYPAY